MSPDRHKRPHPVPAPTSMQEPPPPVDEKDALPSPEKSESIWTHVQTIDRTFQALISFVASFLWTTLALLFRPSLVGSSLMSPEKTRAQPRPLVYLVLWALLATEIYYSPIRLDLYPSAAEVSVQLKNQLAKLAIVEPPHELWTPS
jgi:hypothetical protein